MAIADNHFIREINEKLVLETIINENHISRADISKKTNLNKATVSSIVSTLLEKNLVMEVGIGESNGGRKPIMVTFHKEAALSLSIDLRNNAISSILTYLDGTIILKKDIEKIPINKRTVLKNLKEIVNYHLENAPATPYGLIGICIGIHGIVDDNKVLFSPFYSFDDFDLAEKLEKLYTIPVRLENEANLSAIAENRFSINTSNLISISIHTGIGCGIILHDRLFTGVNGFAGEIGHMIVVPNGKKCPCGNKGCLEQYASEQQILKLYGRKIGNKDVTFSELKSDYMNGNAIAIKTIDLFIYYISIGINNIITNFSPEIIIINSHFTREIDDIIEKISASITHRINKTVIQSSKLAEESTLRGGSHVNISHFLGIN